MIYLPFWKLKNVITLEISQVGLLYVQRFENLKKWKDPGTFTEQGMNKLDHDLVTNVKERKNKKLQFCPTQKGERKG